MTAAAAELKLPLVVAVNPWRLPCLRPRRLMSTIPAPCPLKPSAVCETGEPHGKAATGEDAAADRHPGCDPAARIAFGRAAPQRVEAPRRGPRDPGGPRRRALRRQGRAALLQ